MNGTSAAPANAVAIRVEIPASLRLLAGISGDREIPLAVAPPATLASVIDELELRYPALHGTLRDPATLTRRAFIRFFACAEDISHTPLDQPLPEAVIAAREPLLIVGAIAGG